MAERQFNKETKNLVRVKINSGPDFRGGGTPIWSVPPGSPNPNPISDQKMSFVTPAVSDLAFKKLFHHVLRLDSPAATKKIS